MCVKCFVLNFLSARCLALTGLKTFDLVPFKIGVSSKSSEKHQFSGKARRCTRCLQYVMVMEILYANGMKENKSGLFAYELSTLKRGLFEGTRLVLSLFILKEFVYEISLFLNQHKHFHQTDLLATQYVHLKRGI